jgi:glutathionylspermidine synthase
MNPLDYSDRPEFAGAERDRLFRSINMPWYNLCPIAPNGLPIPSEQKPYALYHCHPISPTQLQRLYTAAERVGRVLLEMRSVIRNLDAEALLEYGYPEAAIKVVKFDPLTPFCMRLDWCWNESQQVFKVIEANVQTPSFWFECVEGNTKVAQHFGFKPAEPTLPEQLKIYLNRQLQTAAKFLNRPLEQCHVGFTALNNVEDMGTMRWLSRAANVETDVFAIEQLRIQDGEYLFNPKNGQRIDILFLWYPLEWAIHDRDANNKELWSALEDLIVRKKVAIVNFGSAFALQPKSVFALITDLGLDFFNEENAKTIFDHFPKTDQTPNSLGDTYFAKPVLGRQGEGCLSIVKGKISAQSLNQDPWYTDQDYVYQELLNFPTIHLGGQSMTALWSTWLYNDGTDHFVPAGVGLRLSSGQITDDDSYWCPIGIG